MARREKPKPKFTIVNLRLFTEDVEELKRRAEAAGEAGWQPRLRLLVHAALRAKRFIL
jgi:predicted DNA binding CopG/RHH family protein